MRWRWRWLQIHGGSATDAGWKAKDLGESLSLTINCTCHTKHASDNTILRMCVCVCVRLCMHTFTTNFCVHFYQDIWLKVTDMNRIDGCICAEAAVAPLSGLHGSLESWSEVSVEVYSRSVCHITAVSFGLYSYWEATFQCVGTCFASLCIQRNWILYF